jgi:hypothetical protein
MWPTTDLYCTGLRQGEGSNLIRPKARVSRIVGPLFIAVATIAAMLVAGQAPAVAAPPDGPPVRGGGVDGQVFATLVVGGTVYVGGRFTHAVAQDGSSVGRTNLAAFDLGSGALLTTWRADANGMVRSLASSGNYLYVGGRYSRIGGVAQGRLARVSLATGAVDTGFRPRPDGQVRAVQARGGAVFAGGTAVSSDSSRPYLAKFGATSGARAAGFSATVNGPVNALALSPDGTRLAVGGGFTTLSGSSRRGMGLVDPDTGRAVGPSFTTTVNTMLTLDWRDDGTALFGGSGNANNLAARWNPNTGARSWHHRVGGDVQAIDFYDGDVYVGFHDNYEGNNHTKLLAVDASSGAISSRFRPRFNQFWGVRSISAGPWGLIVGGQFTSVSGVWAHNVVTWLDAQAPSIAVDSPSRSTYGSTLDITVTIPHATGTVTLAGLGPDTAEDLAQGSATFALPSALAAGRYTYTVSYPGDARYLAGTATRELRVTKAGSKVRAAVTRKATTRRAGKVKVAVASGVDGGLAPVGTVKLKLTDGAKHRTVRPRTLRDGIVSFKLPRLAPGSWRLVAKYSGDANHKAASHQRTLRVAKT